MPGDFRPIQHHFIPACGGFFKSNPNTNFHGDDFFPESGLRNGVLTNREYLQVGFVIDPFWIIITRLIHRPNRSILWNVLGLLWIHTTAATTFNWCCVSVDRFIAIRFTFRYQAIVTKKRCFTAIILVWLISLGVPFTRMLVAEIIVQNCGCLLHL